jgi:carbon storage regulator
MRRRGNKAPARRSRAGMLVLGRKPGESIMVGDRIEVSILSVKQGKVKIGITAPESVPVFRKEVYLRIGEQTPPEAIDEALERLTGPS